MQAMTGFETVDPRYKSWIHLMYMLKALDVVELGQTTHRFTLLASSLGRHNPKPHWVRMAVVSLSLDYIELLALPRMKK